MFRNKSDIERKLEKQIIKSAKQIRQGVVDDIITKELQEEEDRKKLIWSEMSPRLRLKLLKRAEERRRNAKKEKQG